MPPDGMSLINFHFKVVSVQLLSLVLAGGVFVFCFFGLGEACLSRLTSQSHTDVLGSKSLFLTTQACQWDDGRTCWTRSLPAAPPCSYSFRGCTVGVSAFLSSSVLIKLSVTVGGYGVNFVPITAAEADSVTFRTNSGFSQGH